MSKKDYKETVEFKADAYDLGLLLTTLRNAKGISMRELEVLSGVTTYHICNIENRKATTTFITMSRLFNGLGYSIAEAYAMLPTL